MPTISDLLEDAESLAKMAVEEAAEASEGDSALFLNAAGKGWNAANLCAAAVLDALTGSRPSGTETRRSALRELAHTGRDRRLSEFRALVGDAFSDLHLRAEEQAVYKTKTLRRTIRDVSEKLVPLAFELCGAK